MAAVPGESAWGPPTGTVLCNSITMRCPAYSFCMMLNNLSGHVLQHYWTLSAPCVSTLCLHTHPTVTTCLYLLTMQAVVGQPLPMYSRVGWGVLTVMCTTAQAVLLHLTYNQLGWRQHSWLSCDLRRKHAAQQQELWSAINRYLAYSRSCMCILALSVVNGLVLALTTTPAGSAGAVVLTPPAQARFLQDTPEDRMKEVRVGVLVSVGLTVLPMLWLALARCAVHCGSQTLEFVATATCVPAGLLPVSASACVLGCGMHVEQKAQHLCWHAVRRPIAVHMFG